MSAHQMSVVEEFCTDILILNKGKTVLQGNLKQIKDTYQANKLEINAEGPVEEIVKQEGLSIYYAKDDFYEVNISNENEAHHLFQILAQKEIPVTRFEIKKPSLHDIFIEKVGE